MTFFLVSDKDANRIGLILELVCEELNKHKWRIKKESK
jgi:hypothetical protein